MTKCCSVYKGGLAGKARIARYKLHFLRTPQTLLFVLALHFRVSRAHFSLCKPPPTRGLYSVNINLKLTCLASLKGLTGWKETKHNWNTQNNAEKLPIYSEKLNDNESNKKMKFFSMKRFTLNEALLLLCFVFLSKSFQIHCIKLYSFLSIVFC